MNKSFFSLGVKNVLIFFALQILPLVIVAQEPNVWLYSGGSVTYEIDADSIAVEESDVPVFPGTKGLICLDRYINDTTTTDTEQVLYIDGKEVELIDPETGNKHRFLNAAVNDNGDLFILSNYYDGDDWSIRDYCLWKNGEIWWKETMTNYAGFYNDIIFDGDNVYTRCFKYENIYNNERNYYYKRNDENMVFYHSEVNEGGGVVKFTVYNDVVYYYLSRRANWNGSGYHSLNSWSSWIMWHYIYDDIKGGRWITTPDFSYDSSFGTATIHKGQFYIAASKRTSVEKDEDGWYYWYNIILEDNNETIYEQYAPSRIYFDKEDNMWVEGGLIDENEDGIDDYYGLETKGVHFWKNGSYYGRVLYQNLVTEDETDTENVEQMFMCDNDFYAIMSTPSWDDNGNQLRVKSALIRNEKTIWVIDGFISKVLFY